MSRFTKQITSYWQQFRTVVRNEYGSIFTDAGVILVLVLARPADLFHALFAGLRDAGTS